MDIDSLQPKISQRIQTIVEKNKIVNAYLLHGSEGSGKEAVALKFSSLLTDCSIDEFLDLSLIHISEPTRQERIG